MCLFGVSAMNKSAIGESWKDVKHEFLTEVERDEIALRVKVISEIIQASKGSKWDITRRNHLMNRN